MIKTQKEKSMILVSQLFKSLILAQIISNVTPSLANISNGLLIGNALSPTSMAALGFVSPTGGLLAAIAAVISLGANILCGNYMGRGEHDKIDSIFTTSIFTVGAIGILLTFLTEAFPSAVAGLLGASGEALPDTIAYIRGLCLGVLPTLLVPSLVVFLNMANEITYAMFSTIVLAVVNLLAGFVNLYILKGGMFGMGFSSALSQYAALLYLSIRFIKKKGLPRIHLKEFTPSYIGRIVILGSPSALMFLLYSLRNIQINSFSYESGGTAALSALGILSSSAGIFDAVNTGIGATVVMLASVMAGEEDRNSLINLTKYCMTFGALLVIIKTAVFASLAHPIAHLFGAGPAEFSLTVGCVYAYALCMPFNLMPTVVLKTYQCLNRVSLTNFFYLLTCIVFPIGIMRFLGPSYGIYGVWSNYALTEVLTIAVILIVCWVKEKHFPIHFSDWLWLENSFSVPEELQFSASITNPEEAVALVEDMHSFIQKAMKESDISLTQLPANQLVTLLAELFAKGNAASIKQPAMDILLMVKKDKSIQLRLRDNFLPYNAEALSNTTGLPISYSQTFGMNILTCTIK